MLTKIDYLFLGQTSIEQDIKELSQSKSSEVFLSYLYVDLQIRGKAFFVIMDQLTPTTSLDPRRDLLCQTRF